MLSGRLCPAPVRTWPPSKRTSPPSPGRIRQWRGPDLRHWITAASSQPLRRSSPKAGSVTRRRSPPTRPRTRRRRRPPQPHQDAQTGDARPRQPRPAPAAARAAAGAAQPLVTVLHQARQRKRRRSPSTVTCCEAARRVQPSRGIHKRRGWRGRGRVAARFTRLEGGRASLCICMWMTCANPSATCGQRRKRWGPNRRGAARKGTVSCDNTIHTL